MKNRLLILFPGIRYSVDCPLLYYTRLNFEYAGYECISADYGIDEADDLSAFSERAVEKLRGAFENIKFDDYEAVIFAEKSVGTVVGMRLEDELNLKNVYHLVYTPIDETYKYLTTTRRIVGMAAGTEDKYTDAKALQAACKKLDIELITIKNAGHRLEAGKDVTADISALVKVINKIGDPSALEKYRKTEAKKIEDEKAAKAKAEAEKLAKEKAEKEKKEAEKKAAEDAKKSAENTITIHKNHVRKYASKDLDELMEIWLIGNIKEQSFIPKKYWNKNFTEIKRIVELSDVFVYEQHGKIYGFISSMEEELVGIYVAEGARSLGIGKLLMDKMKDKMGILEASVYTKNKRAMKFFEKEEFQATNIRIDEATGEEEVLLKW
ncbi:MAG: GNAT family N-acetyltransferase [Eubacterium sp.]|nr:GNAT family N-acetyltransferase [Eubacterium sp.]